MVKDSVRDHSSINLVSQPTPRKYRTSLDACLQNKKLNSEMLLLLLPGSGSRIKTSFFIY